MQQWLLSWICIQSSPSPPRGNVCFPWKKGSRIRPATARKPTKHYSPPFFTTTTRPITVRQMSVAPSFRVRRFGATGRGDYFFSSAAKKCRFSSLFLERSQLGLTGKIRGILRSSSRGDVNLEASGQIRGGTFSRQQKDEYILVQDISIYWNCE